MSRFDHLFTEGQQKPKEPEISAPSPEEGPWPGKDLNTGADGKGDYNAFTAPRYQRREWLFLAPKLNGQMVAPQMLRYDLLMRIVYSPSGSEILIIYADQVYLIKGQRLRKAVEFIADRYLDMLQEFDSTIHRPVIGDEPIIISMEAFMRRDPAMEEWMPGTKSQSAKSSGE